MTPRFWKIGLLQCFVFKMISSQIPSAMPTYIQMGPTGPMCSSNPSFSMPCPRASLSSLINTYPPFSFPSLQNLPSQQSLPAVPNFSNLPHLPNLANFPNPAMALPMPPMALPMGPPAMPAPMSSLAPFPMPVNNLQTPCLKSILDPTVMNNLAIALHLLVLSNLMNSESTPEPKPTLPSETKSGQPTAAAPYTPQNQNPPQTATGTYVPQQGPPTIPGYYVTEPDQPSYSQQNPPFAPPNSKFLGSSGFADTSSASMMGMPPSFGPGSIPNAGPRNGLGLMSPYEALAPSSSPGYPGADIFAQYGPQNLKSDFHSPYQSITANDNTSKDLFSMF